MSAHAKHKRTPLRIVSNSERTASACPRRWWWRYHLGFSGFDSPAPLRQGTLVHRMLAAWYGAGMPAGVDGVALIAHVADVWAQERAAHVSQRLPPEVAGERFVEDQQIRDECMNIVTHYLLHWGDRDREAWEVVAVEGSFARPVPHPTTGKPIRSSAMVKGKRVSRTWVHAGQVDLLVRMRATGDLWFVEHKTTTSEDFDGFFSRLHLDTQVRGYAWALQDPLVIDETDAIREPSPVVGVIYNAIRKAVPKTPKPLQPRKPGAPSPGLSKAAIDTTRDVYLAAVLASGFDPGDYADVLASLERKRFFAREHYPITARELDDWIVDHGRFVLQAVEWSKRALDNPPHRQTSLCAEHHRACEFASLCIEDGVEARRNYRVRTVRHEELPGVLGEPTALAERVGLGVVSETGQKLIHRDPVERLQAAFARRAQPVATTQEAQPEYDDPFA